jgi:hypothetical protein
MTKFSKTTLTASIGAMAIAATFAVTATPAAAGWHGGYGGGLAAGLLGAAIVGSAIASQPTYYATPVYCGCHVRHIVRKPVYNRFGQVVGFRRIVY